MQKTSYESRISDWSSDVCSSDLPQRAGCRLSPSGSIASLATAPRSSVTVLFSDCCQLKPLFAKAAASRSISRRIFAPLASRSPSSNTQILRSAIRLTPDRISPTRRITMRLYLTSTGDWRSEEHTSELQSLMRISYAVFCLTKKKNKHSEDE